MPTKKQLAARDALIDEKGFWLGSYKEPGYSGRGRPHICVKELACPYCDAVPGQLCCNLYSRRYHLMHHCDRGYWSNRTALVARRTQRQALREAEELAMQKAPYPVTRLARSKVCTSPEHSDMKKFEAAGKWLWDRIKEIDGPLHRKGVNRAGP